MRQMIKRFTNLKDAPSDAKIIHVETIRVKKDIIEFRKVNGILQKTQFYFYENETNYFLLVNHE